MSDHDARTKRKAELNRILMALRLELPVNVANDASARIIQLFNDEAEHGAAAEGSHDWQPISTLPDEMKDGRFVLLYDREYEPLNGHPYVFAQWHPTKMLVAGGEWRTGMYRANPTHWRSFAPPSAPSASGEP